jgi:hypothetical protein
MEHVNDVVFSLASRFFDVLSRQEESKKEMRRYDLRIQFSDRNEGSSFWVEFKDGAPFLERGKLEKPHLVVRTSRELLIALFRGEMSFSELVLEKDPTALGFNGFWDLDHSEPLYPWLGRLIHLGQTMLARRGM